MSLSKKQQMMLCEASVMMAMNRKGNFLKALAKKLPANDESLEIITKALFAAVKAVEKDLSIKDTPRIGKDYDIVCKYISGCTDHKLDIRIKLTTSLYK